MENYAVNKNRNLNNGYINHRSVGLTKRTEQIPKSIYRRSLITPKAKFGRTDDEILNIIIAELNASIN
jgi:hypothetical protein